MMTNAFSIVGGDYEQGGTASSRLKAQLKLIGVAPEAIRRAMIAAYEAEMNVVIHAAKGQMRVVLDPARLDVEVADEGPGIADIELAMKEGYSTAPLAARELGFGAGMGLPNIRKNSDHFSIESAVGKGTRVAFTIYLRPQEAMARAAHSVRIAPERCRECLRCLFACPTGALRVRHGRPAILDHLCLDCAVCIEACASGALTPEGMEEALPAEGDGVLVLPGAFLAQFGAGVEAEQVLRALAGIGFRETLVLDEWERALRRAVVEYARDEAKALPVISPACPAVVNLIEMRFPSLIRHVAPFLSASETVCAELSGRRAAWALACPCVRTTVAAMRPDGGIRFVAPKTLRQAILAAVLASRDKTRPTAAKQASRQRDPEADEIFQVSGIRHVIGVLEQVENGLLEDVRILEPRACEQGCAGSPLFGESAFIARYRYDDLSGRTSRTGPTGQTAPTEARAVRRVRPLAARAGLRLDKDMAQAIRKLSEMDALTQSLPGKDCGRCGAPTCAAFAEDVVMGRTSAECPLKRR